jgi:hypothetical protein
MHLIFLDERFARTPTPLHNVFNRDDFERDPSDRR